MEPTQGIPSVAMVLDGSTAYDYLIGQTISSNFRLGKRLGSGAMATVFQAEQISLGKMVAIKVMRSELMADPNLIQRFELEARAASTLNHPNLVQIIDCGRDRGFLYIAMELLTGIDLGQLMRTESRLPLERSARIIDQVLSGVDEAHTRGVVHRDLKPENIMLVSRRGDPDFVKVCDFGVAKACGRERPKLTVAGLVFGTPEYMSPEQARGVQVDGRSDLYSIATILYELVVGKIPFASSTPADVLARQLLEAPALPSSHSSVSLPPALEDLIMRGLAKNVADRPQTAAEFQGELHLALADVVDHWPSQGLRTTLANKVPAHDDGSRSVATLHGTQPPAQATGGPPESPPAWSGASPPDPAAEPVTGRFRSLARPRRLRPKRVAAVAASLFLVAAIVSTGAFVVGRQAALKQRVQRPIPSAAATRPPVRRAPVVYALLPGEAEPAGDDEPDGANAALAERSNYPDTAPAASRSSTARAKHMLLRTRGPARSPRRVPAAMPARRDEPMAISPGTTPPPASADGAATPLPRLAGSSE